MMEQATELLIKAEKQYSFVKGIIVGLIIATVVVGIIVIFGIIN